MENQLQTNQKKIDVVTYLIFFLSGLLGISLGYIVFRLDIVILGVIFAVFAAFVLIALLLNKRLLEQNNLLFQAFQQESLIKKNNILAAFIRELEYNANVENIKSFRALAWRNLRTELFIFPENIYDVLEQVYQELGKTPDLQGPELKDYLFKESAITSALATLRDQQQKIKRQLM